MKKNAGIWIDHRNAVVVFASDGPALTEHVVSGHEAHTPYSGRTGNERGAAEDQLDHKFTTQLDRYYDAVINKVREAKAIVIFGPGEAKGELKKRFVSQWPAGNVTAVETVDKMTEPQIVAKVQQHYKPHNLI